MANRRETLVVIGAVGTGISGVQYAFAASDYQKSKGMTKTLRWCLNAEPPMLNAGLNTSYHVQSISSKTLEGLVRFDASLEPIPHLARRWRIDSDGLKVRFELQRDVQWHDGQPFTSMDVKYSFEEILKKLHPRGRTTFKNLSSVEIIDKYTVDFTFTKPAPYLFKALSGTESPILPKHIYDGSDPRLNPANNAPIGTGPFVFERWERGSNIQHRANKSYWMKDGPKIDKLITYIINDTGARTVAIENQQIAVAGFNPIAFTDLERFKKNRDLVIDTKGYEVFSPVTWFQFNMRDKSFQDVRVRQAFAHAIDREAIVRSIWRGYATPATGPIRHTSKYYSTQDVPAFDFNPAKAEALLDEAGLKRDSSGVRLRITHDPAGFTDMQRQLPEYIKENLRQVGIDMTIRRGDPATFIRRVWGGAGYQTASFGLFTMLDPTLGVQRMYWSENIIEGVAFSNGSGYANPDMDSILVSASTEIDEARRKELFQKVQILAMKDLPIIPIVDDDNFSVYRRQVVGIDADGEGVIGSFSGVSVLG